MWWILQLHLRLAVDSYWCFPFTDPLGAKEMWISYVLEFVTRDAYVYSRSLAVKFILCVPIDFPG